MCSSRRGSAGHDMSAITPHPPLRILHCPGEVGGNPQSLARAERKLGLQSVAICFEHSQFKYASDEVLFDKQDHWLVRETKRWGLLWRALREFDVVHFNFGRTIMPTGMPCGPRTVGSERDPRGLHWAKYLGGRPFHMCDLPILKAAGKGIVVTYQGDDARQGDYCRSHFAVSPAPEVEEGYYSPETDRWKRRCIATMGRYADRMYAVNPDLLHVLPAGARFIPYANVDPDDWKPVIASEDPRRPPVVLHAPSHRGVKGTAHILRALERLRAEHVEFEFILVEHLTHAEARRLYERADLLVDQLLCGWYGGVAVELMALGKPVIAYIREEDLGYIPAQMRADLPVISATPDTIYRVLREWLTVRRSELRAVGRDSRAFVEQWHHPTTIAAALKEDYEAIVASKRGSPN